MMTDDIEAAVAAAIQASRPAGVNLWDVPELEQAIRHVAAVARRDALRETHCLTQLPDEWLARIAKSACRDDASRSVESMCPPCRLLAEAEEAVRRDTHSG